MPTSVHQIFGELAVKQNEESIDFENSQRENKKSGWAEFAYAIKNTLIDKNTPKKRNLDEKENIFVLAKYIQG